MKINNRSFHERYPQVKEPVDLMPRKHLSGFGGVASATRTFAAVCGAGGSCPVCGSDVEITSYTPKNKPRVVVTQSVCVKGHCEVETAVLIDWSASQSRSTTSLLFSDRHIKQTLDGSSIALGL